MKTFIKLLILGVFVFGIYSFYIKYPDQIPQIIQNKSSSPLNIEYMRSQKYPGSDIVIEESLPSGSNYKRYIVSFRSDGLKEYAYMTIPLTQKPDGGFPVIIFNHGYQIPKLYTPDGNYIAYMDALAKEGYIIFKPDFRGNGKSQGSPVSSYFSPDYSIDVLNAISSIKKYSNVDTARIGMWGHSMGGAISLRVAEISSDIKAVVIWSGVVGSYNDIIYNWQDKVSYKPEKQDLYLRNLGLAELLEKNGSPAENPDFWKSVDPSQNLKYINNPFQLHVGLDDNQVPPNFSKSLFNKMIGESIKAEYFEYPGANHDINQSFDTAMKRTVAFFSKYLK
jgi:uncharacterized protein